MARCGEDLKVCVGAEKTFHRDALLGGSSCYKTSHPAEKRRMGHPVLFLAAGQDAMRFASLAITAVLVVFWVRV
jgi:hypothetical protein